jgi:hypothetical protein
MSVVSKSTRSDDHPPDWYPIPAHTHNTVEKGMVLPGYGNPIPVPVPMHTRDRIITVLPVPMSLLRGDWVEAASTGKEHFGADDRNSC